MPRPKLTAVVLSLCVLAFLTSGGIVSSAPGGANSGNDFVPGELIVKFQPNAKAMDRASARAQLNAVSLETIRGGIEHWKLGPGQGVEQAIARLKANPKVKYAEPNYHFYLDVIPNDPSFGDLYGLVNTGQNGGTPDADIDAEMAWNVSTGSRNVVVGLIDTGCDYNHADLAANIWTNQGEIAGNGIDDDGNGKIDDIHGYDFINNDSDPLDDHYHGTHTAGTIGAVGNNGVGVVGVNWQVSIMCLKIFNAAGSTTTAAILNAVDYSIQMGVDLTSNSWGGGAFSQALYDLIQEAGTNNQAFVAAAGNDGVNTDTSPHYPSAYDLANIIAVAATDRNDLKASFSNYGLTTVDLGAPGVDILSTSPGNSYRLLSGTSMATPHVSGVAALVRAVAPGIPVAQMKQQIMTLGDPVASMQGRTVSGRRLNAFFPIATPDTTPPGAVMNLSAGGAGSNFMGLSWTATADDDNDPNSGTAAYYEIRYATSPIDGTSWAAATLVGNAPVPLPYSTAQSMEVKGLTHSTTYYFAMKAFDEWGNAGGLSNVTSGTTLPPPTVSVAPTTINDALLTGQQNDWTVTLQNAGDGSMDFSIPTPALGQVTSVYPELPLGKDEPDPRQGILGSGGPDAFGHRWVDSDQVGGPAFDWVDISSTGTQLTVTGDDAISPAIPLSFNMPFYGTLFNSIRACTNGFLSFTDSSTAYANQPLPNAGGAANMVAPFWDDLDFGTARKIYFQDFGTKAIVQWHQAGLYTQAGPTGSMTFQAVLEPSGIITFQYLTLVGAVNSNTIGIQNATKSDGLTVAFNANYLHDNMAVRILVIPQWLTVTPTNGRLFAGESTLLNVHLDASGLEGGTYPGTIHVQTNDPVTPDAMVNVFLHVQGAPDAAVQPSSLAFGDAFLGLPETLTLIVVNNGTDTLHVSDIQSSHPDLTASPTAFNVAPHGSQNVTVTWTPSALGPFSMSLTVLSDDAGEPSITVPVTGNSIPAPVLVADPTSFNETLYSGDIVDRNLRVTNAGGSNLVLTAGADLGPSGNGIVYSGGPIAEGSGGPDAFGYRWRDSDAAGGPVFNFQDISATGTQIFGNNIDDSLSPTINMGMTFPYYGNNFTSLKVSSNGWLTFTTTETASRNSNRALPDPNGTTTAPNMIAMWWDDLHTRSGNVKYQYDGSKFIVQYTHVGRFSATTGADYTFQVQLYPNGKIVTQYQTMVEPPAFVNSATIGIQNQTKTIGLTVVNNASYIHNNLAIQFARTPDWLVVSPFSATIPPGGYQDFNVRFDATDRPGGVLNGNVVFNTNIPSQPQALIPAMLTVIGAPQIALVPTSFNYGTVFVGYAQGATFQIVNNGTDVLNVSSVTTTDPALVVEENPGTTGAPLAAFTLAPGESRLMGLRWTPMVPYALNAFVEVASDDPDDPLVRLTVTGLAIDPPIATWTPPSYTENLLVGDVVTRNLHVENDGGSDLTFATAVRLLNGAPVPIYQEFELKKDEVDPRQGILGSGGPDLYGYRWRDSDHPTGPVFSWQDISATGTPIPITGDDSLSTLIPMGMSFPYYGQTYSSMKVCTNGWITFDPNNTSCAFSNQPLPYATGVRTLVAGFWDDLDFRGTQHARYLTDGTKVIVQWTNVDHHSAVGSADLTFQIILHPNGRIVYQYLTMTGLTNSATIGIQNYDRNDGLTVAFNTGYVHNNMAVAFYPPVDFLSVTPTSGTIPPGGSADLDVRIDTTYLIGGDYAASVDLITNDPLNGLISVPVHLHVTGVPDIQAVPASLMFPTTFIGFSSSLPLSIRNAGTDVLHVTSSMTAGDFSVSGLTTPVDVAAGGSVNLTVTFAPTTDGVRYGSLTLSSDDPDENPFVVAFEGMGLYPPVIGVSPSSISTALPPGGSRTKTETICNTGGSPLDWSAGPNLIDSAVTIYPYLEIPRGEEDPRPGILGSGGPDTFGYRWKDSDDPAGPVFNWVDISTIGTPIAFADPDGPGYCIDCTSGPFPIGFTFPFYGNSFSQVRVTTEGWLSFTSSSTAFSNQPLPNSGSSVPENLIAAFWDDLVLRSGTGGNQGPRVSNAYYHNDGTRLIVQWQHFYRIGSQADDLNFQIILYPSGGIVFQYQTMTSPTLTSATIGQQNATKTDGLTIVHNAAYMHDSLAIEIRSAPDWIQLSPGSGTIPAGSCQDVTVTLNAAGLDDGVHHGEIRIASNDPYTPLVTVPVTLNVGLVPTAYLNFDPDVLNLSGGGAVKMVIELPAGLDPHLIGVGSVLLNDVVPAMTSPVSFSDENGNGTEEIVLKFDRHAVEAILAEGASVEVCVQGEVTDVQWWRGCTTIRALRPQVNHPSAGSYFLPGDLVSIEWSAVNWPGSIHYTVQLTRDGGSTWEVLASNLSATSLSWTASGAPTVSGQIRVLAYDPVGLLGYDTSDGAFTITSGPLGVPNEVTDLEVDVVGADLVFTWKPPAADITHGPADSYHISSSSSPQGPFSDRAVVTATEYTEALSLSSGSNVTFYRIKAANAAGIAP